MTSDDLRRLADAATPGPWKVVEYEGSAFFGLAGIRVLGTSSSDDLDLAAALGPDAARLLADAGDMWAQEHAECVGRLNPRLCNVCSWLDRLDKLGATDGR